jgi:acetyl-CoA C-acetyltransferase
MSKQVYILGAKRTAIGSFQGQFAKTASPKLAAAAIKSAVEQAGVNKIDEALIGCVLPAGVGQAPARQAILGAGLDKSVVCTTVNKVCGSGMKTVMLAHDAIKAGTADTLVAGGMENMTMAPYLLPQARSGYRMGHGQILDHMFYDGLQNPYDNNMMGVFAESCADKFTFTREAQDAFSAESVNRSMAAMQSGAFDDEIVDVTVVNRRVESQINQDEEPPRCNLDKIPTLRPAFRRENGTVTAANSSKISDGAAAMVIASEEVVNNNDLKPLAKIVGHATFAHQPEWFTTAPVSAMKKLMDNLNWSVEDVDLFEINEAFAVVTMAAMQELNIPHNKVNIHGGACAMGHPIGASGTRILVTLLYALKQKGLKRGIASLCIGGGEATAVAIEIV